VLGEANPGKLYTLAVESIRAGVSDVVERARSSRMAAGYDEALLATTTV